MKKLLSKLRFGVVHLAKGGFPVASAVVNVVEKFTGKDLATGELKKVDWSIVFLKLAGLVVMFYLVQSGIIPAEDFIKFIKGLF